MNNVPADVVRSMGAGVVIAVNVVPLPDTATVALSALKLVRSTADAMQRANTRRGMAAADIVIATGSAPRGLGGVTIDRTAIITSDEAINLANVPASIAILGSGAVGVEFASIFRRFGSEVTLVELQPRIAPNEDEAVSVELARAFRKRGIRVRTGTNVTSAAASTGSVRVVMEPAGGQAESITVDTLLVAVGRAPVTDGLNVEGVGLALDRGFIVVDQSFRTNVPGISAIGDVITMGAGSHPQLAHVSSAEGIRLAERLAGQAFVPIDYDHVPACTFCDPEIGSVGLTEAGARARGYDVRTGTFPFSALGRARIAGDTEGFVKIVGETRYDWNPPSKNWCGLFTRIRRCQRRWAKRRTRHTALRYISSATR